jgi:hypothetical protein
MRRNNAIHFEKTVVQTIGDGGRNSAAPAGRFHEVALEPPGSNA